MVYTSWILEARNKGLLYLHFTMEDNLSLSEGIKSRYRSMYVGVILSVIYLGAGAWPRALCMT